MAERSMVPWIIVLGGGVVVPAGIATLGLQFITEWASMTDTLLTSLQSVVALVFVVSVAGLVMLFVWGLRRRTGQYNAETDDGRAPAEE